MKALIEQGPGFKKGWENRQFTIANVTAFVTTAVFTLTGALILFANVSAATNLTQQQASSWVMSGLVLTGISSFALSLYYQQPLFIAPSLPALLIMGPMFKLFSIPEIVAGYIIAALVIFLLGASGIVGLIGKYLPTPIIMGMIAGVFMTYGLRIVESVQAEPVVAGLTIVAFLLTPVLTKKIPPQAVSLVVAITLTFMLLPFNVDAGSVSFQFTLPVFVLPHFNLRIIPAVSIPLILMGLADTLKGYGVLRANGYEPPLNTITSVAGVTSFLGAFFLSHCIVLAGPATAIVASSGTGPKEHRYEAVLLLSLAFIPMGIAAGVILPFMMALPAAVSAVIAGLAMLGLFTSSLEIAFGSKKFPIGAFTAFIVGLSNVTIYGIGAPVWAILFGIVVSAFLERDHF
jgi:benzoate membrane transport protein